MMNEFGIEVIVASYERTIKRLWILCIILVAAIIACNAGWIYYESQYETIETEQEVTQDTGDGVVIQY